MDIIQTSVTLKTLSPVHHGYTAADEVGVGKEKKTMRLVRQVAMLMPNDQGNWVRKVVPVLGGNALRGRLRRVAATETFAVLGITPQDFAANGRRAFHTLTSGGTLVKKAKVSKVWSENPIYRRDRVAEWPLLSLFGFSFDDFMVRSKLRVHFGWPLLSVIKDAIHVDDSDEKLFPSGDWINLKEHGTFLVTEGHLYSPDGQAKAHYEYRHADDDIVPMPDVENNDQLDSEKSGMVMGYQYVPVGVPFGFRMVGVDLTPLEQSLLRLMVETAFPTNDMVLFGSRSASGLGVFRVQRQMGFEDLPDPDLYRQYLTDHREELVAQVLDDKNFLHVPKEKDRPRAKKDKNNEPAGAPEANTPEDAEDDTADQEVSV